MEICYARPRPYHRSQQTRNNTQPDGIERFFCTWTNRLKGGATRDNATQLMALLMPLLPDEIKSHIKPFELRGLGDHSVKIPMSPSEIRIWSDNMKAKRL